MTAGIHSAAVKHQEHVVHQGEGLPGAECDFRPELSNPDCWYLCDVSLPDQVSARTVLLCSIDNDVISVSAVPYIAACCCLSSVQDVLLTPHICRTAL